MDRRQEFLAEFLGALGAVEIRHLHVTPAFVSGTVVYESSDAEEQQAFRWSVSRDNAPSPMAIQLAGFIRADGLLSIDKLRVSRQELLARFSSGYRHSCSPEQAASALEEILAVQVPMLDDGEESDYYFIHD